MCFFQIHNGQFGIFYFSRYMLKLCRSTPTGQAVRGTDLSQITRSSHWKMGAGWKNNHWPPPSPTPQQQTFKQLPGNREQWNWTYKLNKYTINLTSYSYDNLFLCNNSQIAKKTNGSQFIPIHIKQQSMINVNADSNTRQRKKSQTSTLYLDLKYRRHCNRSLVSS